MLIMNLTFCMHIYPENSKNSGPQTGEHVSDWFIKLLEKYPDIIATVLENYIECVITSPVREWKTADEKVAIGYAAKYDAALYAKCNKSCTHILLNTIVADDAVGVQLRSLELIERILQQQTQVEWRLFRHDVATIPREVALIRETMRCLDDRTFTVRRKACQVLTLATKQGSPITKSILQESISSVRYNEHKEDTTKEETAEKLELNLEKPEVVFSFEGHDELIPEVKKMPQIIFERFLDCNNGLARCSGIALIERLVLINPRIIYETNFEREMSLLAVDTLSSVRKAGLETVDTLLQTHYNCSILIEVYCRIWPCLLSDEDTTLQKLALHSFNRNVLLNVKPLEFTKEANNILPWRILTTLLSVQPRDYLQQRLTLLLQQENIVTPRLVNTIISHLSTSMSTEAWTLLLFLSSRITNNLDSLITTFNRLSSCNVKSNQVLALQLISYCLPNFSKAALNQLFKRLLNALSSGSIWLALVSPAVLLLTHIDQLSLSEAPQDSDNVEKWQPQLLKNVTTAIKKCMSNFQSEYIRMLSLLATYTEIVVMSPQRADQEIVQFVLNYLQLCTRLTESNFDTDNERIMNWFVVIAGRLALRDNELANRLSKLYGQILKKNDRPQLINSTLIGMNDLGKKYPSILQNNMQCILSKMRSKYATTRVRTYRCVKDVILAGNIKLKGPILISLLAGLIDESAEVAQEADAFFIRYQKLYDKLLFQHCLKEIPFDFNGESFLSGSTHNNFASPLKGAERMKDRRLLYNHIISSLTDNTLLLYFGQLKLLAEKSKDTQFIKSPSALDVITDVLFIMRRICYSTKARRQQGGGQADDEQETETAVEETLPAPTPTPTAADQPGTANANPKGRGRNARKRELDMEPLKQVEHSLRYVEELHRNLKSVMNAKLQQDFDKFCRAMAMRFPNYTDFAQPAKFWQKYKQAKNCKTKAKRRRLNDDDMDTNDDQAIDDDSDSDNELPLERHKTMISTAGEKKGHGNFDVLATELLFQPHDW